MYVFAIVRHIQRCLDRAFFEVDEHGFVELTDYGEALQSASIEEQFRELIPGYQGETLDEYTCQRILHYYLPNYVPAPREPEPTQLTLF